MTDAHSDHTLMIERMCGLWSGGEELSAGPGQDTTFKAEAAFETTSALGGLAAASEYTQTMDGAPGMRCHTLFRFDGAGGVSVLWTPAQGDPLIFTGTLEGAVVSAAREDADGTRHLMTADYSTPAKAVMTMTVTARTAAPVTIFTGTYTRRPPVRGRDMWRDLSVPDASALHGFYEKVIGWRASPCDMGGYSDYNMLDASGEAAAGVCHAKGPNEGLPPVWLVYFTVASVETAVDAVRSAGGTVLADPKGSDGHRYAVIRDPAGATFAVYEEPA